MSTSTRFKLGSAFAVLRNGAKGTATEDGEALHLGFDDGKDVEIRFDAVERWSFNGLNGLWAIRLKDGNKITLQTTGRILSVGDRTAGREFNKSLRSGLANHGKPHPFL